MHTKINVDSAQLRGYYKRTTHGIRIKFFLFHKTMYVAKKIDSYPIENIDVTI